MIFATNEDVFRDGRKKDDARLPRLNVDAKLSRHSSYSCRPTAQGLHAKQTHSHTHTPPPVHGAYMQCSKDMERMSMHTACWLFRMRFYETYEACQKVFGSLCESPSVLRPRRGRLCDRNHLVQANIKRGSFTFPLSLPQTNRTSLGLNTQT